MEITQTHIKVILIPYFSASILMEQLLKLLLQIQENAIITNQGIIGLVL
jgi:hypothetical protein